MSKPYTESPSKIELVNFKLNKGAYVTTVVLTCIMLAIPLIILGAVAASGNGLHVGVFITFLIFGLSAYFFYRLGAWNKYGKENFILENGLLVYQPEARKISFRRYEFALESLTFKVIKTDYTGEYQGEKEALSKLCFINGEQKVETAIRTPHSVILELAAILEKWGIQQEFNLDEIRD